MRTGAIVDLTNLVTKLVDSVKDRKFAAELREIQRMMANLVTEHATLHEQRIVVMSENADLKQKLVAMEQRVAEAERRRLQEASDAEQFVEHRGILLKRKSGGGYHLAVYCPSCRLPMGTIDSHAPFHCGRCKTLSNFPGHELEWVIHELQKSDA